MQDAEGGRSEALGQHGKKRKTLAQKRKLRIKQVCWALVVHAWNPSYLGGRDQADRGSKPAWANSSMRSYLEKTFHKNRLMEWINVKALSSSPSVTGKNP
jgi:hypothetical protein